MKVIYTAIVAAGIAAAHPHQHGHTHHHARLEKRVPAEAAVDVEVLHVPTTIVYQLNGKLVSDAEVKEGIKNGTLIWADGAPNLNLVNAAKKFQKAAVTTATTAATVATTPAAVATTAATTAPAPASAPASAASSAAPSLAASSSTSSSSSSSSSSGSSLTGTGVDSDFPDGTLDCSTFPSAYGAINLAYLGLGGWTGIQSPGVVGGALDDITTVPRGGSCGEGNYCSYACPAGYQKSQWPSVQGATGQSVGGLLCSGGKLKLTNSALSTKLCIPGVSAVNVVVENQMGQQVAICRTDYPGTESETVPVAVAPGATQPLTCPDNSAYYQWKGSATSAQYYVNPAGYGIEEACQWGDGSKPIGNWAPLNLGIGWSAGSAFVSLFPNKPTTDANLDYKVVVSADANGQSCTYSNGQFVSSVGGGANGCTISASSGTIRYTLQSN